MKQEDYEKLVDDYGKACLKAGQSNSGYTIDVAGPVHWEHMQELRKKLKAVKIKNGNSRI